MAEYFNVVERAKFAKYQDFYMKAKNVLSNIETKAVFLAPTVKIDLISDKDDNKILELADFCSADFIITGNTNDFTFSQYKQTKIVNPRDYWENYRIV